MAKMQRGLIKDASLHAGGSVQLRLIEEWPGVAGKAL